MCRDSRSTGSSTFPDDRGLVSTPLVADGVLYFVGTLNIVRAVDATNGAVKWSYDPKVMDVAGNRVRSGWDHSRGIALWKGKIYVATWDGRLIAVDAGTGREIWSTMTVDPEKALYITGAPKVFKGKVLIGNGGTEHGAARGYVTAYDAETGRAGLALSYRARAIPRTASRTRRWRWRQRRGPASGGSSAAAGMPGTASPTTRSWISSTSAPATARPGTGRSGAPGAGTTSSSPPIVALNPDTGEYLWHYQTTPGETWDYNSNMDIVLADLPIGGDTVKAMLHAPKNGFFYVIDRRTGKLLSADPFSEVTWASKVDLTTGRPVEVPGARYESGSATVAPGTAGAHTWHAMSYNPGTGLVYIPTIHRAMQMSDAGMDLAGWRSPDWKADVPGEGFGVRIVATMVSRQDGVMGSLQAWDPVKKQRVWEVPLPGFWNPGTMTTAGNLVFQGRADGVFVAYDATTGAELWRHDLGLGISAPPITYAVNGRQYVALLVGWGAVASAVGGPAAAAHGWAYGVHRRRLVAFSLDGTATLPAQPPPVVPVPFPSTDFAIDADAARRGGAVFVTRCRWCHGTDAVTAGMTPDLRASAVPLSASAFAEVVRDGSRRSRGMPRFEEFTDQRLEDLRHYIRQQAEVALAAARAADR